MNLNKIAIAYRIYPKVSKEPAVFKDDKFKLSEFCLKSFHEALNAVDYKIWVLLDNCPREYKDLFRKYFPENRLVFVELPGIGNAASFAKQIEILLEQNYSEYIYFAEDDYYYLPDAFSEMLELITKNKNVDFITSYDHKDYYTIKFHNYKTRIEITGKQHWRLSVATCLTFLTTKKILRQTRKIFLTYTRKNYDSSIWMCITKLGVFKTSNYLYTLFKDKSLFKSYVKAWIFCPLQILFGRRYKLYSPIPSLSTHLEKDFLSPTIDWNKVWGKVISDS
jgi:hypothetical protein